jgi:hypothetical protein
MDNVIIKFQPNSMLACNPPKWNIYYRFKDGSHTYKLSLNYYELKLFIEKYGIETNNVSELSKMHIDTTNIVENIKL